LTAVNINDTFMRNGMELTVKKPIAHTPCRHCAGHNKNNICMALPDCSSYIIFVAKDQLEAYAAEAVARQLDK
jgi:hypothetical protein